ncbi:MAG: hypothetical protein ACPGVA_06450 [Pikeienuella sp.]
MHSFVFKKRSPPSTSASLMISGVKFAYAKTGKVSVMTGEGSVEV